MYPLGRQDLTQQGAGKSWVGVLPSSDLRSGVGNGGCGRAGGGVDGGSDCPNPELVARQRTRR